MHEIVAPATGVVAVRADAAADVRSRLQAIETLLAQGRRARPGVNVGSSGSIPSA